MINPKNFPYGTVSVCRVPKQFLKDKGTIRSNFSGCMGCGSGKAGVKNIFGNKYGQNLAKIQILREKQELLNVKRLEDMEAKDSTWYEEKESIHYSDGSSTDDDETVDTNEKSKRKATTEVSISENVAKASLQLAQKKQKQ